MSDEYQMRKDIDGLSQRLNNIKNELIENGLITEDSTSEEISSILGTVFNTISDLENIDVDLTDLTDIVGDSSSGLVKEVSHISSNLDKYHLPSSDLNWSYIFTGSLNISDITSLENNYDIPTIAYAYRVDNNQWYEKSGSSFVTTSTAPSHPIGVCDTLPSSSSVTGSSLSFYIYELSTMDYYKYTSNDWVKQTDLSDFFTQTNVYSNVNDDFTSQSDFDTLDGQINDTNGLADTVESHTVDIGTVDVDVNSDLQTQILNIVGLMKDLLIFVGKVDSIEEVSSDIHEVTESGITTYYYEVAEDYPYEFIQINGSNEYYQKVSAIVNNTPMVIWEWCLNPFIDKFKQTTLYDILTYFFTERATPVGVATDYTVLTTDLDTTNISEASIYFYKQFNIVTINYYIQTVSGLNTVEHTVIQTGKIPSAFRPSTPFTQTISDYGGSTIKNAYLKINTDGSMKFKLGASGSIGTYGTLRYIVED